MIASLDLCFLPQRNPSTGPPVVVETPHASGASTGVGTCADASILRGGEHHQRGSNSSRTEMQEICRGGPRGSIPHDGSTELRVLVDTFGLAIRLGVIPSVEAWMPMPTLLHGFYSVGLSESNGLRMGEVGLGF